MEGQVPVFVSARNRVAQLYPGASPLTTRRATVEVVEVDEGTSSITVLFMWDLWWMTLLWGGFSVIILISTVNFNSISYSTLINYPVIVVM
jgi:hypothetical protein